MDQKALIKKALGKIKKLAMSKTAERYKAKAESKKAPPAEVKAPKLDEPEVEPPEPVEEEAEEVDEPEDDIMKKTTLVTVTRAGAKKPALEPVKKKGRKKL